MKQLVLVLFRYLVYLAEFAYQEQGRVATWTPVELMPDRKYTLQLRGLLFFNGAVSKQKIDIPFFFVNSKAQIPNNVTVYYLSRI